MKLTKVESSMIYAVGYDPDKQTLEVVFFSGGIYRYLGVPQQVYDELMAAGSKGQYMRSCIINVYPDRRVGRG